MQFTEQSRPTRTSAVWSSGEVIVQIFNVFKIAINQVPWKINDQIVTSQTPETFASFEPKQEISEFEMSMMELIKEGLATEEYVQDVFQQEQIFKDNFERINKEFPNKAIVVCGGEVFTGDSLEEVEKRAAKKYPNRPPYSYSPAIEL